MMGKHFSSYYIDVKWYEFFLATLELHFWYYSPGDERTQTLSKYSADHICPEDLEVDNSRIF